MILGIGTDITNINHFKKVLKKSPAMIERIFTTSEIIYAKRLCITKKEAYYAKRFSGKEAISKACGTGIGKSLNWKDIEILNDKVGAPTVNFSAKALTFLKKKFKTKTIKTFISLSDEEEYVLAFALLTK